MMAYTIEDNDSIDLPRLRLTFTGAERPAIE